MNQKTIVLNVLVPDNAWDNVYIQQMTAEARQKGVKGIPDAAGTVYPISMLGISKLTADHFAILESLASIGVEHWGVKKGVPCAYVGTRYAIFPASKMDNLVDVTLPHARQPSEVEGEDGPRRVWNEYVYRSYELESGEFLVNLNPRPFGADSSDAMSMATLLTFKEALGEIKILTQAEGDDLIPKIIEPEVA